jgi:hypothetical protein
MKLRMNTNRPEWFDTNYANYREWSAAFTPLQLPNSVGAYFLRSRAVVSMLKRPEGRAPLLHSCSFVSIRGQKT